MLDSWNDGAAKAAIIDFVGRVSTQGPDFVPPPERIAVFDNDGTLWCEKPAYVQLDFLVRRLAELARADPALAAKQPYQAAVDGDLAWFGDAVTKHYNGDDSAVKVLASGILSANMAITVEEHAARVDAFFATATHPTLGLPYAATGYTPMVELLRYLEAAGFTNFIVSGGGRDFMRPITGPAYGIPPERVIGSSVGLSYRDGNLYTTAEPEFLNDGPVKVERIWGRVGRRPIFAAGNSNGDIQMLEYTQAGAHPSLSLLVLHDDAEREFDYVAGAEKALDEAAQHGWTVASVKSDWATVFGA